MSTGILPVITFHPTRCQGRLSLMSVRRLLSHKLIFRPCEARRRRPWALIHFSVYGSTSHQVDARSCWRTNILSFICGSKRQSWIQSRAERSPPAGKPLSGKVKLRGVLIQSRLWQSMTHVCPVHLFIRICVQWVQKRGSGLAEMEIKGFLYAGRVLKKITI